MEPRITVVTPSFNQARFLGSTLQSVVDQRYPNLEHIVVDGGSTDGSVDLIRAHESQLAWWVSEPDRGQSHAINKGLSRATGDILCWLNSDDYFAPGALGMVASALRDPATAAVVVGHTINVDETGVRNLHRGRFRSRRALLSRYHPYELHQPSIFWRREVTEKIGLLDESRHLIMDFDYWLRASAHFRFANLDAVLSICHRHADAKTADNHIGYHAARRQYLDQSRAELPVSERVWLALLEPMHRLFFGVGKGIRRTFRPRERPQ